MAYTSVNSQGSMLFDERRNRAYLAALEPVLTLESVVLDLGAGVGVHGLLAAQLGAKRVYLVEPENVVHVAERAARDNGLADRVVIQQERIERVTLPEKVDVITSVFTGNFLLSEDLLPSLFYARDRYLKPGGVLIPDRARMVAAPVSAPALYERRVERWSRPHLGLDFSAGRPYAANTVYFEQKRLAEDVAYLAEPQLLLDLDLMTATEASCHATVTFSAESDGLCHGLAGWFDMRLGDNWLSTAPHEPEMHWSAAFLPLAMPVALTPGESLTLSLIRQPFDEWHWRVEAAAGAQQMSGFRGQVLAPGGWRLRSLEARPKRSLDGEVLAFVLDQFDGRRTVADIAADIIARWPELAWPPLRARQYVSRLARSFGTLDEGDA